MIDLKKIKLGDKLKVHHKNWPSIDGRIVTVVGHVEGGHWITQDEVGIEYLHAYGNPESFTLVEENQEDSIKSDGGSSDYYQKQITRLIDGESFDCQTGDIIRSLFMNDFDAGNIFKALDRIFQNVQGKGKEGTSIEYDCNKIIYFANILKERFKDA